MPTDHDCVTGSSAVTCTMAAGAFGSGSATQGTGRAIAMNPDAMGFGRFVFGDGTQGTNCGPA